MKYLSMLTAVAFTAAAVSCSIPAQSQTGETTAAATASTRISAEFTKKLDTKDAKPGDEVDARTLADAMLSDGATLPKGTRLVGTVIDVHARSNDDRTAHLAFRFDRAILRDGRQLPLRATLTSVTAPRPSTVSDNMFANPGATNPATGSTGNGRGSGGGGLGGGGLTGGSIRGTSGITGAANSATGNPIGGGGATAGADVKPVASTGLDESGRVSSGSYVSDALSLHRYPVGNMPGVILSSQANAPISGSLDANGRNITVDTGTQMTMNASVAAH